LYLVTGPRPENKPQRTFENTHFTTAVSKTNTKTSQTGF